MVVWSQVLSNKPNLKKTREKRHHLQILNRLEPGLIPSSTFCRQNQYGLYALIVFALLIQLLYYLQQLGLR